MQRWNGWGDNSIIYPLPARAAGFLEEFVGPGTRPADASLASVLSAVPPGRLPYHALVSLDAEDRLRHARGQSLPDWIALRSGRIATFPDGVAYPLSNQDVRELMDFAGQVGARIIPYGGGTSVVGHINPQMDQPTLTIDLSRLNRLLQYDSTSQLATFGAGVAGPDLEALLRAQGVTLGHFPQSFEYSTLGGWIATRSSGQQSLGYGRIEALFAGGVVESPAGTMTLPPFPASAAGPDLRELFLGSEGRMGILTEATVRTTPLAEREEFHAIFLPDWERAVAAARAVIQARLPLSMLRLSTPVETETMLALAGHERLIAALERLLSVRRIGKEKCMLLMGFTGNSNVVKISRQQAVAISGRFGGVHIGRRFGDQWHKGRFRTPYLRNTLWQRGYAVDTLETATAWTAVPDMVTGIENALHAALEETGERVHVFTHLSHLYPTGSSIYVTYLFRLSPDPDENLERWRCLKAAASEAIVVRGGTISHQHGVGKDHAPYLAAEKGALGMRTIRELYHQFDPAGILNPGTLLPAEGHRASEAG
ncbi:MAG: FAD-binding oxidoreductase [Chloroflexota bacterium]|nr:FAD-binding oxidoreductase [Chloroflexota bacterium]